MLGAVMIALLGATPTAWTATIEAKAYPVTDATIEGHQVLPTWQGDGRALAFRLDDPSGARIAYVSPVGGGQPQGASRVRPPSSEAGLQVGVSDLAWIDHHLLFSAGAGGRTSRIYRAVVDDGAVMPASELLDSKTAAGWLTHPAPPSGVAKGLTFSISRGTSSDLAVWSPGDSTVHLLTQGEPLVEAPAFDAAGSAVVFVGATSDGEPRLVVTDLQWEAVGGDGASGKKKKKKSAEAAPTAWSLKGWTERPRAAGGEGAARAVWAGQHIVYFARRGAGWDLERLSPTGEIAPIATGVALPRNASPAVSPDGAWVAWTSQGSDLLHLGNVSGTAVVDFDTGLRGVSDIDLALRDGRLWAAVSGLGEGDRYRRVYLVDLADVATEPPATP